jgi:RNA polymerase sigma-70 factor (ECF subfamily)
LPESAAPDDPGRTAAEFGAWVAPHLPALAALAEYQVGAGAAEDVVHETLVRAWRRRETYDPTRGTPRAWLVGVLLDRARRHRMRRPRTTEVIDAEPAARGVDPTIRVDVERAVGQLPQRQRQLVALHYLADLPIADVASVLGLSAGAVKAQLYDARAKLRSLLETDDD